MQNLMFLSWPIVIIFIVIILLAVCIVCVAVQDSQSSQPRAYVRTSTRDPWQPVEEMEARPRPWTPSEHQIDVLVCSCGKWNALKEPVCWNCRTSLVNVKPQTFMFEAAERCAVCGYWVYPGELVVLCPSCHVQGHRTHMLEFLKAKGTCPVCKVRLSTGQLLAAIPIVQSSESALAEEDL
jgi:hypothetical protein